MGADGALVVFVCHDLGVASTIISGADFSLIEFGVEFYDVCLTRSEKSSFGAIVSAGSESGK